VTTDGDERPAPRRVPELTERVTDEDRNRYGVLLDHAAERGLLSPTEYRLRLADLAEATSIDECRRIVTELPIFDRVNAQTTASAVPSGLPPGVSATGSGLDSALWAGLTPAKVRRGRGSPWLILVAVLVLLVMAMVALGLIAAHFAHAHTAGLAGVGVRGVSRLRL
jgi:hypothetical protein